MKKSMKRLLSLMLVLVLCLGLLPTVSAAEEEKPTAFQRISTDIGGITVATGNVVLEGNDGNRTTLSLEVDGRGLGLSEYGWTLEMSVEGAGSSKESFSVNYVSTKYMTMETAPSGWKTVSITIRNKQGELHGTGELQVYFARMEDYPLTLEEVQQIHGQELVTLNVRNVGISAYLPANTFAEDAKLRAELLNQNGTVVGMSVEGDWYSIWNGQMSDKRYDDIFKNYNRYDVDVQSCGANVYLGEELSAGEYDVRLTDENGKSVMLEKQVRVTDKPMASLYSGSGLMEYKGTEPYMAAAMVEIPQGDPADFQVELWRNNGERLGVSGSYRLLNSHNHNYQYYIPLEQNLSREEFEEELRKKFEAGEITAEEYEMAYADGWSFTMKLVRKDGAEFEGERELDYYPDGDEYINHNTAIFGSRFYANVLIQQYGLDPETNYRLELLTRNGVSLGTAYGMPSEEGILDMEFTDESGALIALAPGEEYKVELYRFGYNSWYSCGSAYLYNDYVADRGRYTLMSDDVMALDLTRADARNSSNGQIEVYMKGSAAALQQFTDLERAELQLANYVTGQVTALVASAEKDYREYGNYYLIFDLPEDLEQGYYVPSLYYNGKLLVYASSGEALFAEEQYPLLVDNTPDAGSSTSMVGNNPLRFITGFHGNNVNPQEVTADFFAYGNLSGTPDYTVELEGYDFWYLTQELPPQQYQAVLWTDGKPLAVSEFGFWLSDEKASEYERAYSKGSLTQLALSVGEVTGGTLELIPCFGETGEGTAELLSEIYVKATADRGYRLKPNSIKVNGEPITGRAFVLTEDSVVTAEFELAATYEVNVVLYEDPDAAGSVVTINPEKPMEGETVTVSLELAEDAVFNYLNAYKVSETGGMQTLSTTKQEDGTWTFIMPDSNVKLEISLRERYDLSISAYYDKNCGTLSWPEGLKEGDEVTLTATPTEGYCLTELYYYYYDYSVGYEEIRVDLITEATEKAVTASFTVPTTYVNVQASFGQLQAYSIGSVNTEKGTVMPDMETAMPGTKVTLTVTPAEHYMLTDLKGTYKSTTGTTKTLEIDENEDGTWSFAMPWNDVSFTATFVRMVPGGVVTDLQSLAVALGDAVTVDEENATVKLKENLYIQSALDVQGGVMKLDTNRKTITAMGHSDEETAVLIVRDGTELTLSGSGTLKPPADASDGYHGVLVLGGKLSVEDGVCFYGGVAKKKDTTAAMKVTGGEVLISNEMSVNKYPYFYGQGCGDALRITGGTVTVNMGYFSGGTYWENMPDIVSEPGLQGGGFEGDRNTPGGSGIWVSDVGCLTVNNCYSYAGANQAALKVGTEKERASGMIRVNGGTFGGNTGGIALWVPMLAADLQISGGKFYTGYNDYWWYSVLLGDGLMENYLPNGYLLQTIADQWEGTEAKLLSAECSSYDENVEVVACGLPVFAKTEVSDEDVVLTETEGAVTVYLAQLGQRVDVAAAFYDEGGRLVGLGMVEVGRGTVSVTLGADLLAEVSRVRVFLLDGATDVPLSECLTWEP